MGNVRRSFVFIASQTLCYLLLCKLKQTEGCSQICTVQSDGQETCATAEGTYCAGAAGFPVINDILTARLTFVDLGPVNGSTPAKLHLHWSLESGHDKIVLNITRDDAEAGGQQTVGKQGDTQYCFIYTLPPSHVATNKTVILHDSCMKVDADSVYDAALSTNYDATTSSDNTITYRIQTPKNVTSAHLEDWAPVSGISVRSESTHMAEVWVVMETPDLIPDQWYNTITLRDSGTMNYNISRHNTSEVVYTVQTKGEYTEYYATIEVYSSRCGDSNTSYACVESTTAYVHVNAMLTSATTVMSNFTTGVTTADLLTMPETVAPPAGGDDGHVKYIVIGLVVGVVVVAACLVFGFMLHRWWKRRRSENNARHDFFSFGNKPPDGMELIVKAGPSVLILYSCDCERHEQVIVEFASYLKHTFYCQVAMDLWEQNDIQARGAVSWLLDKLETCHYVLVVCSVGARLKCVRGRSALKPRLDRPVPDIFPTALDYVTEKMWLMRNEDKPLNSFIVVCFEYAGENDIPPKLDLVQRYFLPSDLPQLFCHMYGLEFQNDMMTRKDFEGRTALTLDQTDTGKQLLKSVASAREFFSNNPNWLLEEIERDKKELASDNTTSSEPVPITNPALSQVVPPPSLHDTVPPPTSQSLPPAGINSPDNLSQRTILSDSRPESDSVRLNLSQGGTVSTSSLASDEDAGLLEQRNRKRQLSLDQSRTSQQSAPPPLTSKRKSPLSPISPNKVLQDGWFSVVRHSKKLMRHLQGKPAPGYSNLSEDQIHQQQNGVIQIGENGIPNGVPLTGDPPAEAGEAKRATEAVSDDEDSLCSVEQLQRDCDFIQNFDIQTFNGGSWSQSLPTMFEHPSGQTPPQPHSNHSFTNPMCMLSPLGGSTSVVNGNVPTAVHNGDGVCDFPLSHNNNHHDGTITFA